jgi:hypothetical protein
VIERLEMPAAAQVTERALDEFHVDRFILAHPVARPEAPAQPGKVHFDRAFQDIPIAPVQHGATAPRQEIRVRLHVLDENIHLLGRVRHERTALYSAHDLSSRGIRSRS